MQRKATGNTVYHLIHSNTMKKLLLLTLCMLCSTGMYAENRKSGDKLPGIWQQVQKGKHESDLVRLPVWKVIQGDGRFCTFLIANAEAKSIITNEGTYEVTSDSTFVEHVQGSITDPGLIGKANKITYIMPDKDTMHISYRLEGATRDGYETWIRVKLEIP